MIVLLLRAPGGSPADVVLASIPAHVLRDLLRLIDTARAGSISETVEIRERKRRKAPVKWVLRHSGNSERARDVLSIGVEICCRCVLAIDVEVQ